MRGGGGGSSDSGTPSGSEKVKVSEPPSNTTPETDGTKSPEIESPEIIPNIGTVTMESLNVPDGFNFNTLDTFTLTVSLSSYSNERSFVSLYSDYNSDSFQPIYSSKIVTAELSNGETVVSFTLNRAKLPIIAEVRSLSSNSKSQVVLNFALENEVWKD